MSIIKPKEPKVSDTLGIKYLILYIAVVVFLRLAPAAFASSAVVINEFYSAGSSDWVEIYNNSEAAVDLSSYGLFDAVNNPKSFNCILAPHGFSVIDWNTKLNKSGDTIFLKLGDETVDCISFGNGAGGSCPGESGPTLANPADNQVGARMPDGGTWQLTTNSTKDAPNDGSPKSADAVCLTPTPTPSPTPIPTPELTPKPSSTPKPATATPVPTGASTPTSVQTSILSTTDDNLSSKVLAEADEKSQPEVNLEVIDLTATAESEVNASPTAKPKSGRPVSPVFIISAAGVILMLGGGIPLIIQEIRHRKK